MLSGPKDLTNGVTPGLVLGSPLFMAIITDPEEGAECKASKFANDTNSREHLLK